MTDTACPKCNGAGWVWGHEIDPPDFDTDNRYMCPECSGLYDKGQGGTQVTDWRSVWQERTSGGWDVLFAIQDEQRNWLTVVKDPQERIWSRLLAPAGTSSWEVGNLLPVTPPTRKVLGKDLKDGDRLTWHDDYDRPQEAVVKSQTRLVVRVGIEDHPIRPTREYEVLP